MKEPSNVEHFYVYVLLSLKDKNFYIGYSTNLKERLLRHKNGYVIATKSRRPLKLLHYEYFRNMKYAKAREKYLKSGYGREQLRSILKQTLLG